MLTSCHINLGICAVRAIWILDELLIRNVSQFVPLCSVVNVINWPGVGVTGGMNGIFICPSLNGTYYGMALSVHLSVNDVRKKYFPESFHCGTQGILLRHTCRPYCNINDGPYLPCWPGAFCNKGCPYRMHLKLKSHAILSIHNIHLCSPIVLNCCTQHDSITAMLYVKFQNY